MTDPERPSGPPQEQKDLAAPPAAGSGPTPPPAPGADAWTAPPVVRVSRRNMWLAGLSGVALLATGVWLVVTLLPRLLTRPDQPADDAAARTTAEDRRIQATLFYVSSDGDALISANRAVLYAATPAEQARRIVEAAVEMPPDGHRSAIPAGTTVRAVFLGGGGQAYVDLGGAIVSGQPGGSLDEALAVYTIVNAVTVNLPGISAVQILVEGRQVDTLTGHLDLRYPLAKALDWVRKGS